MFPDPEAVVAPLIVQVKLCIPQLSEAVVEGTATIPVHASAPVTVYDAGQVIVGSTLSVTFTVCVHVAVLPLPSVTVQVTVVGPSG